MSYGKVAWWYWWFLTNLLVSVLPASTTNLPVATRALQVQGTWSMRQPCIVRRGLPPSRLQEGLGASDLGRIVDGLVSVGHARLDEGRRWWFPCLCVCMRMQWISSTVDVGHRLIHSCRYPKSRGPFRRGCATSIPVLSSSRAMVCPWWVGLCRRNLRSRGSERHGCCGCCVRRELVHCYC